MHALEVTLAVAVAFDTLTVNAASHELATPLRLPRSSLLLLSIGLVSHDRRTLQAADGRR
jgi:hypothetical protein